MPELLSNRPIQARAATRAPSAAPAAINAAFARVLRSLEELTNDCRVQGIDPMTMLATLVSGVGAPGASAALALGVEPPSPLPAVQTPSDTDLGQHSRDLVAALDRGDVAAVAAALAPGFVAFKDGAATDGDLMRAMIAPRAVTGPYVAKRTWSEERVVRRDGVLVYTAKAHEVQAGNETKGGYVRDAWYAVQWVRTGEAWRVQFLTRQEETTDHDWWNNTFHKGRGFSRDPNRLLVETVQHERPGAALELAMGQGRNALYLASQGWQVTGVDSSDEGLRIAREQASERNLALDTIHADIDAWDFGENRFDLVTLMYAGDHGTWSDRIKASLRPGGLFVVEGWAKNPANPHGFSDGLLAKQFADYEILRDETVEDVPDWAWDRGKLVRFVARKPVV